MEYLSNLVKYYQARKGGARPACGGTLSASGSGFSATFRE